MTTGSLNAYYAKRALEYEEVYRKPERQEDLAWLKEHLRQELAGHRVLELACGTGYWTAELEATAESIHATDASVEVLSVARRKQLDPKKVTFAEGDAYRPVHGQPPFTAGFAGFWWSHVPKADLAGFLAEFHGALQPGSRVVFIDNRFVPGSSTAIARCDAQGNTYQSRLLSDGSRHEVLKNFPTQIELRGILEPHASDLHLALTRYFWYARFDLK